VFQCVTGPAKESKVYHPEQGFRRCRALTYGHKFWVASHFDYVWYPQPLGACTHTRGDFISGGVRNLREIYRQQETRPGEEQVPLLRDAAELGQVGRKSDGSAWLFELLIFV